PASSPAAGSCSSRTGSSPPERPAARRRDVSGAGRLDEVTSFLREPFVEGHAHEGGEEPAEGGSRQAIGELLTCTRCVGTWTAGGLAATQVLWPRFGRLVTWTLAAAGANDFLQAGFAGLTAKANELER